MPILGPTDADPRGFSQEALSGWDSEAGGAGRLSGRALYGPEGAPAWARRRLWRTSLRSCRMRTDPNASTSKAPRATAASSATPSGSVPDSDTNLTFELRKFCNTNNKMAANRTRTGSTRVHVRLARVEGIVLGAAAGDAVLTAFSSAPVESSDTASGAAISSAVRDFNSRVPTGTPNLPPCDRGAIARIELTLNLSHFPLPPVTAGGVTPFSGRQRYGRLRSFPWKGRLVWAGRPPRFVALERARRLF